MQPTSASMSLRTDAAGSASHAMSDTASRPPGLSTRWISRNARSLSGTRFSTQLLITTSTESSSTGRASISPLRNSTLPRPDFSALARAFSSMASVISTPITRPAGPTLRAARKQSKPAPLPRSSTVSPGCIAATACGLPQDRPRFAPSGSVASSSAE